MCGLILAPGGYDVSYVMDRMSYRGKENRRGRVWWAGWCLGHVRLAIQDMSGESDQPLLSSTHATAFVGEIFNHNSYSELFFVDEVFNSDTDQIMQLDGFWSVVTVKTNGDVYAYTDYLGQKPLYYWEKYSMVCSEIVPMFELRPPPQLDRIYLANVIKFGYDYSGRTPYQGIIQIPPGTRLFIDGKTKQPRMTTYWDWSRVRSSGETLITRLARATQDRLIGERPIALLYSGGLDSSIVKYLLESMNAKVQLFSVDNDESEFQSGTTQIRLPEVTLNEAMEAMQVPVDLGSVLPQYQLAKALYQQGYNVCLSGDGADELFGGYRRQEEYDAQYSDVFCELPYYHLPRLDRIMMRWTVELRSPFLAPDVIKYALALPYKKRIGKNHLKEVFSGLIPKTILNRAKHPLKTKEVINGGIEYRKQLVQHFITQNGG